MPPSVGCCAHAHDCEEADCGPQWSLHEHVDLASVRCLNETIEGSCKGVFKEWSKRLEPTDPPLESNEDDPELLIHIPFSSDVKVKAICIVGGSDGTAPASLKVYINRDDLDFGMVATLPPTQTWDLQENGSGELEYPVQISKFNNVHSLDLYIPSNFGADRTVVHFIGFKGEFLQARVGAVTTVYEAKPMPSDHKVPGGENRMRSDIS